MVKEVKMWYEAFSNYKYS